MLVMPLGSVGEARTVPPAENLVDLCKSRAYGAYLIGIPRFVLDALYARNGLAVELNQRTIGIDWQCQEELLDGFFVDGKVDVFHGRSPVERGASCSILAPRVEVC